MNQEQTPQNPTESATEDAGSLEAAALAFEKREAPQGEEEAASNEAETETDDPNAEAEEGQPDEDTEPEQELAEIEYEGVKLALPKEDADKLQKALLRQADYSRKMNAVAEKEKAYTERIERAERLVAASDKVAEAKAAKLIAMHQAQQFAQLDWATLEQEDPAKASLLAVKAMNAQQQLRMADQAIQAAESEVSDLNGKGLQDKRAEMFKAVEESLKVKWTDEIGASLTQYATANGVAFESLAKLTDPGLLVALHKAKQFDELQKKRAELKPVNAAKPVLKPGAPRKTDQKSDAMARLKRTNSVDDAAAAFLSRM